MSSWVPDIDRSLIVRPRDRKGKSHRNREIVFCKLGRHSVGPDVRTVWLKNPLGLSCEPCAKGGGWTPPAPIAPAQNPPTPAKVPAPRIRRTALIPGWSPAREHEGETPVPCMIPRGQRPYWVKVRPGPPPKDPSQWEHGKRTTYVNHGCRCEPCTEANRTSNNARYAARKAARV